VPLIDSSVNFAAEQSVALVELTPKEINQVEGAKTVTVAISSGSGYVAQTGTSTACASITNHRRPHDFS